MIEQELQARAHWWAEGPVDGPTLEAARRCTDDFLACLALGRRRAEVGPLIDAAGLGGTRSALVHAGAVAHALEWDDSLVRSVVHPGVVVVPAALAAADRSDRLLRAVGAGYDLVGYLGEVLGEALYARWQHPTAVLGAYGAAAAACVGTGRVDELGRVISLVPSFASGSMNFLQDGSWTKGLQTGWASALAFELLDLAGAEFPSPSRPLSGRGGLGESFAVLEWPSPLWASGDAYVNHAVVKPHPSCRLTHGAIECALAAGAGGAEVDAITIELSPRAHAIVGEPDGTKREAVTLVERQFSAHYCVAAALVLGDGLGAALLGAEVPEQGAIRTLARRVSARVDPGLPLDGCRLSLQAGGAERRFEVPIPSGDPRRPLGPEDRRRKWRTAAGAEGAGDALAATVSACLGDPTRSVDDLLTAVDPASRLRRRS